MAGEKTPDLEKILGKVKANLKSMNAAAKEAKKEAKKINEGLKLIDKVKKIKD